MNYELITKLKITKILPYLINFTKNPLGKPLPFEASLAKEGCKRHPFQANLKIMPKYYRRFVISIIVLLTISYIGLFFKPTTVLADCKDNASLANFSVDPSSGAGDINTEFTISGQLNNCSDQPGTSPTGPVLSFRSTTSGDVVPAVQFSTDSSGHFSVTRTLPTGNWRLYIVIFFVNYVFDTGKEFEISSGTYSCGSQQVDPLHTCGPVLPSSNVTCAGSPTCTLTSFPSGSGAQWRCCTYNPPAPPPPIPLPGGNIVSTALGPISTDPAALVQVLLRFAIGIGGGIALILMALGAIQMITSTGNPESLKKGQEQFTSAVIGLLFIIFAVMLLQIIGVSILDIPGFL